MGKTGIVLVPNNPIICGEIRITNVFPFRKINRDITDVKLNGYFFAEHTGVL